MDEKIIDEIVSNVNNNWNKDEKIRFVYIELGKKLVKNIDFFLSLDNKLGDKNLTIEQMKDIYDLKISSNKVICKTSAEYLHAIFNKIGIESNIEKTVEQDHVGNNENGFNINHFFVSCIGENNKIYFLTLTPDLVNIKLGFETEHFGKKMFYIDSFTNKQYYQGPEINCSEFDLDELKEIDIKLGYIKTSYLKKVKKEYIPFVDYNSYALKMLTEYHRKNHGYKTSLCESSNNKFYIAASKITINKKQTQLDSVPLKEIPKKYIYNWEIKLANILTLFINKNLHQNLEPNFYEKAKKYLKNYNFDKWIKYLLLMTKDTDLQKMFYVFRNLNLEMEKESPNGYVIRGYIDIIASYFINPNLLPPNNPKKYLSSYYIAQKFSHEMPKILDCGYITSFSKLENTDQNDIFDKILKSLFSEITIYNSYSSDYDDKLSPINNRIIIAKMKNHKTNKFKFLFYIKSTPDSLTGDYAFVYNPQNNSLKRTTIIKEYLENDIISNRINSILFHMENGETR
jgi:hypothetical protein